MKGVLKRGCSRRRRESEREGCTRGEKDAGKTSVAADYCWRVPRSLEKKRKKKWWGEKKNTQ